MKLLLLYFLAFFFSILSIALADSPISPPKTIVGFESGWITCEKDSECELVRYGCYFQGSEVSLSGIASHWSNERACWKVWLLQERLS